MKKKSLLFLLMLMPLMASADVEFGGILANIEDGAYTTEEAIAKFERLNERVNWVNNNLIQKHS